VLRSDAAWPLKATVVAFGSVLMVPYVQAHDLAIPFAAQIWCLRTGAPRSDIGGAAFIGALWALPFGLGILLQTQGVPLLPLVLAAFAWRVAEAFDWRRYTLRFPAKV
jgi:hypothetical protein